MIVIEISYNAKLNVTTFLQQKKIERILINWQKKFSENFIERSGQYYWSDDIVIKYYTKLINTNICWLLIDDEKKNKYSLYEVLGYIDTNNIHYKIYWVQAVLNKKCFFEKENIINKKTTTLKIDRILNSFLGKN